MIRCIAIDDEPLALKQLSSYIARVPFLDSVGEFNNALDAMAFLADHSVDLIFVDINMPDLNGIEFVRSLVDKYLVIFTTAYSEYAIESYRLDALDYLLKPIGFSDFMRSANKANQLHELITAQQRGDAEEEDEAREESKEYLSIKADYKVMLVKINEIDYLESEGEYVRIHTQNGEVITTLLRLKNMESKLPSDSFMRVHRSYIINLKHIRELAKGRVYFADKSCVPIGENYKEAFNNYIEKYFLNL